MNIEIAKTHPFEIEELACKIVGLDYDEIDANTNLIEEKILDVLGVDLQQFQEIVNRLLPLMQVGQSPLTKKVYKGFVATGSNTWLVKTEVL